MLPIAVLPAAALLLRFGQSDLLNIPWMAAAGNAIFSNLSMIFAVGIAIGLAGGEGFQNIAVEGQMVEAGTPIVRFDCVAIEKTGRAMISPVVTCGAGRVVRRASGTVRAGQDVLFVVEV